MHDNDVYNEFIIACKILRKISNNCALISCLREQHPLKFSVEKRRGVVITIDTSGCTKLILLGKII